VSGRAVYSHCAPLPNLGFMTGPIHLQPTHELAPRVLLPGDPGRALFLAQELLTQPRMFNHNRGLWGYTGEAPDGAPLTIQSTGMGGPSAAIVISELVELGARKLVRVGTCGGLDPRLELGALLIATSALGHDGTSRALGGGEQGHPSPELTEALVRAAGGQAHAGAVVSTDLFYDSPDGQEGRWVQAGAEAVEMEAATLFALAARRAVGAAAILIVSDLLLPTRRRIDPDQLRQAERRLGRVAVEALSRSGRA
jgi:DeoD family purine-nucleoside phosphorylase